MDEASAQLFDWLQLFVARLLLQFVLVPLIGEWLVDGVAGRARVDASGLAGGDRKRELALDVLGGR
jgi:hypothetical protein